MPKTSYIRGYDDDVCFVLDQHAWLDLYGASSLKQQSAGRHVPPLWTNYPDSKPASHCPYFLVIALCLAEKQQISIW